MNKSGSHIWGRPKPVPDQCVRVHTYAGGCIYNADDPYRPRFPAELRPGYRSDPESAEAA